MASTGRATWFVGEQIKLLNTRSLFILYSETHCFLIFCWLQLSHSTVRMGATEEFKRYSKFVCSWSRSSFMLWVSMQPSSRFRVEFLPQSVPNSSFLFVPPRPNIIPEIRPADHYESGKTVHPVYRNNSERDKIGEADSWVHGRLQYVQRRPHIAFNIMRRAPYRCVVHIVAVHTCSVFPLLRRVPNAADLSRTMPSTSLTINTLSVTNKLSYAYKYIRYVPRNNFSFWEGTWLSDRASRLRHRLNERTAYQARCLEASFANQCK